MKPRHAFSNATCHPWGLMLALCLSATVAADPVAPEKGADQRTSGARVPALAVQLDPSDAAPPAGEPIRFKVRANRACYIYLYATDPAVGSSTLIFPNRRQSDNRLPAGRALTVPGAGVDYVVAAPGLRQVTMVASTRHLEIQPGKTRDIGDLTIASAKDLDAAFAAKGVQAQNGHIRIGDDELVVLRLDLRVADRTKPPESPPAAREDAGASGTAFVASGRSQYRQGETLRIVFGADRKGWVHLYVIEPTGRYSRLAGRETNGHRLESVTVRAEAPLGNHALVAAHTAGPDFDERQLDPLLDAAQTKGLRLVPDDLPLAVHRITVVE